jgi:hypothetical protein
VSSPAKLHVPGVTTHPLSYSFSLSAASLLPADLFDSASRAA